MKILLTGATGYIGKRLLPVLIEAGHEVVCCVRDSKRFNPPKSIKQKLSVIEIDFLDEIKQITSKFINEPNLKTIFLKPLYGDASGVRGAALLGRENFI